MNDADLVSRLSVALARVAAEGRVAAFGAVAAILGTGAGAEGAVLWELTNAMEPGPAYRWAAPRTVSAV